MKSTEGHVEITVLTEDSAHRPRLRGEHGLCLYVETPETTFLFDTGQSDLCIENARKLDIDLDNARDVVLSHGHYDHTGGLPALLETLGPLRVFAHPAALEPKVRQAGTRLEQIGIPLDKKQLEARGAEVVLTPQATTLDWGAILTGAIPRVSADDEHLVGSVYDSAGHLEPDSVEDDQALVLPTSSGLIVLVGCAHAGLCNTVRAVRDVAGSAPIRALVGGYHLHSTTTEDIRQVLTLLHLEDVRLFAPCHCSGIRTQAEALRAFPGQVKCLATGDRLVFDSDEVVQ